MSRAITILTLSLLLFACAKQGGPSENTSTPPAAQPPTPVRSANPQYEGYLDIVNCDGIHGWVYDKNSADAPVPIEIYADDKIIYRGEAVEYRENLVSAGKGNGKHAFTAVLSPPLKDDKPHTIRVRVANDNFELGNSPKTVTCSFPK